jgi:Txe/YoeB family toxin of Txe-Axe toxin-antitoxin module
MDTAADRPQALENLRHWLDTDRRRPCIMQLIEQTLRSLFTGPGKPEPLKLQSTRPSAVGRFL